jgi:lipopolysaccharide transport system permease protein
MNGRSAKRDLVSEMAVTTLRPTARLEDGLLTSAANLGREFQKYRSHIWIWFLSDFRKAYAGTNFGIFWKFLMPLVPVLIYTLLGHARIVPQFPGVSGAASIGLGVTLWFFLSGCVSQPMRTVETRNSMVTKTALPLSATVFSGFGELVFDTLVRLGLVMVVFAITGTVPALTTPLAIVVLLLAMLFFFGLGLVLSMINVVNHDVGRVVGILLAYGIFISGVIFPISGLPLHSVLAWNPFYVFIEAIRDLTLTGTLDAPVPTLFYSAAALLVFLYGCRVFYVMEIRVRGIL